MFSARQGFFYNSGGFINGFICNYFSTVSNNVTSVAITNDPSLGIEVIYILLSGNVIIKQNSSTGEVIWQKTITPPGAGIIYSIGVSSDGSTIYVFGKSYYNVYIGYILKMDSDANIYWFQRYNPSQYGPTYSSQFYPQVQNNTPVYIGSTNIYTLGYITGPSNNYYGTLNSFALDGTQVTPVKTLAYSPYTSYFSGVTYNPVTDKIIMCGYSTGTTVSNKFTFGISLSPNLSTVSQFNFENSNVLNGVVCSSNGNIYYYGQGIVPGTSTKTGIILNVNSTNTSFISNRQFRLGFGGLYTTNILGLAIDSNDNMYALCTQPTSATPYNNLVLIKYSPISTNIIWQKVITSSQNFIFNNIRATNDYIYITGQNQPTSGPTVSTSTLFKLPTTGDVNGTILVNGISYNFSTPGISYIPAVGVTVFLDLVNRTSNTSSGAIGAGSTSITNTNSIVPTVISN